MANYTIATTWEALGGSDDILTGNDLGHLIDESTEFFTRGVSSVASVWVTMDPPGTPTTWSEPRHPDHTPLLADGYYLLEIREEGAPTNRSKGRARRFVHVQGHVNPRAVRDAEIAIAAVQAAQRELRHALHEWEQVRTAIPQDMQDRLQERIQQ